MPEPKTVTVTVDAQGNLLVARPMGPANDTTYVAKLDPHGSLLWQQHLASAADRSARPTRAGGAHMALGIASLVVLGLTCGTAGARLAQVSFAEASWAHAGLGVAGETHLVRAVAHAQAVEGAQYACGPELPPETEAQAAEGDLAVASNRSQATISAPALAYAPPVPARAALPTSEAAVAAPAAAPPPLDPYAQLDADPVVADTSERFGTASSVTTLASAGHLTLDLDNPYELESMRLDLAQAPAAAPAAVRWDGGASLPPTASFPEVAVSLHESDEPAGDGFEQ